MMSSGEGVTTREVKGGCWEKMGESVESREDPSDLGGSMESSAWEDDDRKSP